MRFNFLSAAFVFLLAPLACRADVVTFNGLTGINGTNFTTYDSGNYTVTQSTGQFYVATAFGNPTPDIFGGSSFGPSASSVVITRDGGGSFDFLGVDLANAISAGTYTFTGLSGVSTIFTQSGSLAVNPFVFNTVLSSYSSSAITSLRIALTGGDYNIDNIQLNGVAATTPEPSSLVLLGTGVLGVVGVLRRRLY